MSYRNQARILNACVSAQGCRQQLHWVLAVQVMGSQEVQWHHWSTGERPEQHLTQVRCKGESQPIDGRPINLSGCRRHQAWCGGHFLLSGWHAVLWWGVWQCHCCQMLHGLEKFRKLLPVLTSKQCWHLSPNARGKAFMACVCSAMLHGSETWGPNILDLLDLKQLCCNDRAMIRWICCTKDRVETYSVSLLQKIGIQDITAVLCSGRLGWYGHVQQLHAMSCIKSVTDLPLPGPRGKGKPRKTRSECVKTNISNCGLTGFDPQDRDAVRPKRRYRSNPLLWSAKLKGRSAYLFFFFFANLT